MGSNKPIVGAHYDTKPGESLEVIAVGTQGVVVEYIDGRVELIDSACWHSLQQHVHLTTAPLQSV